MKRIVILVILVSLAAVSVMGQDYGAAVRTNTLTRVMLEELDFADDQIDDILDQQNRYMHEKAERVRNVNELKLKITDEFNSTNANLRKINRLLERISRLNLDQDKEQAELYVHTRQMFGVDRWETVVRGTDAQNPLRAMTEETVQTRVQVRDDSGDETPVQTQTRTSESSNGSNSSGSSTDPKSKGN